MTIVLGIVCILLFVYWLVLIVRIILSWLTPPMSGPGRTAWNVVYAVTEPVLGPLRRLIPPVRAGTIGFDLSPIIVFVAIAVLRGVLCPGYGLFGFF